MMEPADSGIEARNGWGGNTEDGTLMLLLGNTPYTTSSVSQMKWMMNKHPNWTEAAGAPDRAA